MSCMVSNSGMFSCILLWLASLRRCTETQLNISVGHTERMGTALSHVQSHHISQESGFMFLRFICKVLSTKYKI
jgi:hypothetical protein